MLYNQGCGLQSFQSRVFVGGIELVELPIVLLSLVADNIGVYCLGGKKPPLDIRQVRITRSFFLF